MAGKLNFELGFGSTSGATRRAPESPLKILYIGNFAADTAQPALSERSAQALDIDTFDTVMARIRPTLNQFGLTFESVDDFHPDELLKAEIFAELVNLRARLSSPTTFPAAAQELRDLSGIDPAASAVQSPSDPEPVPEDGSDTFANLLNEDTRPVSRGDSDPIRSRVQEMLKQATAPYIEPDTDPEQAPLLAAVEELLSARLCGVLHDPIFQSLEAGWRWLGETIQRVETDETLKLAVLPATREELTADASGLDGDITNAQLYDTLITRGVGVVGADPWTYVVADFQFDNTDESINLLSYLAALASSAGAQLITGGTHALAGCAKINDLNASERWQGEDAESLASWQTLRHSGLAQHVYAAAPRILTRYPYSPKLNPVSAFEFDEQSSGTDACLWANAAYICAIAVAEAYVDSGWNMNTAAPATIGDLPTWQIDRNGSAVAQPTTEVSLGETAAAALINRGLTPVCHVQGTNEARMLGLHSALNLRR